MLFSSFMKNFHLFFLLWYLIVTFFLKKLREYLRKTFPLSFSWHDCTYITIISYKGKMIICNLGNYVKAWCLCQTCSLLDFGCISLFHFGYKDFGYKLDK